VTGNPYQVDGVSGICEVMQLVLDFSGDLVLIGKKYFIGKCSIE